MGGQASADALTAVTQAIDDLAAENLSSADSAGLTGRVANVWALIGDMDPELTRRAAGYHHRRGGKA